MRNWLRRLAGATLLGAVAWLVAPAQPALAQSAQNACPLNQVLNQFAYPPTACVTPSTTVAGQACANGSTCGLSQSSNVLTANVALNNVSNFFTGPTVAQGSSGTWCAIGGVQVSDTGGAATFDVELTDGATVVSSRQVAIAAANGVAAANMEGCLSTPAGNLRINVKDVTATTGNILFNQSGLSKDSYLFVFRIQ